MSTLVFVYEYIHFHVLLRRTRKTGEGHISYDRGLWNGIRADGLEAALETRKEKAHGSGVVLSTQGKL